MTANDLLGIIYTNGNFTILQGYFITKNEKKQEERREIMERVKKPAIVCESAKGIADRITKMIKGQIQGPKRVVYICGKGE